MRRSDYVQRPFPEVLAELDPDTRIAVGGNDGAGYFYFGTVGDFYDGIEKIKDEEVAKLEERRVVIRNSMKALSNDISRCTRRLKNSEYKNPDLIDKIGSIKKTKDNFLTKLISLNKRVDRIQSFNPKDLMVVDIYNRKVDTDIAIIVDKSFIPSYWFKEEFDRRTSFIFGNSIDIVYQRWLELEGKYDIFPEVEK